MTSRLPLEELLSRRFEAKKAALKALNASVDIYNVSNFDVVMVTRHDRPDDPVPFYPHWRVVRIEHRSAYQ